MRPSQKTVFQGSPKQNALYGSPPWVKACMPGRHPIRQKKVNPFENKPEFAASFNTKKWKAARAD